MSSGSKSARRVPCCWARSMELGDERPHPCSRGLETTAVVLTARDHVLEPAVAHMEVEDAFEEGV